MALTQKEISQLYVALLNRAADAGGVEYWQKQDQPLAETAQAMIDSQDGTGFYPASNRLFIEQIYTNTVGLEGQTEADIQYWVDTLAGGMSRGELVAHMVASIMDPAYAGTDFQNSYINRVAVSDYVSGLDLVAMTDAELVAATTFDAAGLGVVRSEADANVAKEKASALISDGTVEGETTLLTVGQDFIQGTANNDTFIAYVAQNVLGQQVNTLGSGDVINGGAGNDTLEAQITTGAWTNGNALGGLGMPIAPVTKSVENIILHAEIADIDPAVVNTDTVVLNAKNMEGVNKIASNYSDADLIIQNLTSKGVQGGTKNMTVGMEYTGNADTNWAESDLSVYFDQDYLVRSSVDSNSLYYFTQDRYATQQDGKPFGANTAVDGIQFRLNGEVVVIRVPEAELLAFLANVPADRHEAYQEFTDLLSKALVAKNAELNGALDGFTITLDKDYVRTHGGSNNQGDQLAMPAPAITLTAPENVVITNPVMHQNARELGTYDMYNDVSAEQQKTDTPVRINVDLEKVGLAADGGALVIGSMNKDGTNTYGNNQGITVTDTVAGFDEFNVHVAGNKGKNSSLASMHSTDNTLRKVTIDSKAGGDANLTIGNTHSTGPLGASAAGNATAFKDVQVMDASAFRGDLTLFAGITGEVAAKYFADGSTLNGLNIVTKLNSYNNKLERGADNLASFEYKGGAGNDVLDIAFDEANTIDTSIGEVTAAELIALQADSTVGVAAQAHGGNVFQMNIDGGAGNDTITLVMDAATALTHGASNITINGGLGNDLINIGGNADTYTVVISFNGNNFGTDTIVGFKAAVPADARVQTQEVQVLDFEDWFAHDDSGSATPQPEEFTIKIGTISWTFKANAANMTDADIAILVAAEINGKTDASGKQYFTATVDAANPERVVLNTDDVATHVGNINFEAVTVTLNKPASSHVVSADKIIHSTAAETFQEGGAIYFDNTQGADVLDFSSYNVKGVSWYDNGGITGLDATFVATTGVTAAGDKFLYLVESAHHDGFYDVFLGTDDGAGSYDAAKGTQLVGSIDFGVEQAFQASNFIW